MPATICYAVTVADVNGDQKPDVVAVTEDAVVWYENPSWRKHDIIRKATARDNVCIQPHDIDGDGRVDFALGAGWRPPDTKNPSTLQWLGRDAAGPLAGPPDPLRGAHAAPAPLGRREGDGQEATGRRAVAGPRHQGPELGGRGGGSRPRLRRSRETRDASLAGRSRRLLAAHDPQPSAHRHRRRSVATRSWPRAGRACSCSTATRRAMDQDSDRHRQPGRQTVQRVERGQGRPAAAEAYLTSPRSSPGTVIRSSSTRRRIDGDRSRRRASGLWSRQVIAEPLQWGHAVWCADLDGDGDDELIIGQRDPNKPGTAGPRGPGVFVFDPKPGSNPLAFERHTIDDGGMACEDALAADLDGDGRADIIAGGRATHNVQDLLESSEIVASEFSRLATSDQEVCGWIGHH